MIKIKSFSCFSVCLLFSLSALVDAATDGGAYNLPLGTFNDISVDSGVTFTDVTVWIQDDGFFGGCSGQSIVFSATGTACNNFNYSDTGNVYWTHSESRDIVIPATAIGSCTVRYHSYEDCSSTHVDETQVITVKMYESWSGVPGSTLQSAGSYSVSYHYENLHGYEPSSYSNKIYTSETPDVCDTTIAGLVTNKDSGLCVIRATIVNNGNQQVSQSWTITPDIDLDGLADSSDNCPSAANGPLSDPNNQWNGSSQLDTDSDSIGDICDDDLDGDGVLNVDDNCIATPNAGQEENEYGVGLACWSETGDLDNDGVENISDNCPQVANADGQSDDVDGDGEGDACDADIDNDTLLNAEDNCPSTANLAQDDSNQDGVGDACERRYVALDGDDANGCTSWSNACATLQRGINSAIAGGLKQVFVKSGIYKPASTVNLQAGVSLIGGFAGTELKASDADASTNLTIISGDTSGDDTADADGIVSPIDTSNNANNLATLVSASGQGVAKVNKITLQGFILNAANNSSGNGAALVVDNSYVELLATKVLANAAVNGGGAYIANAGVLDLTSATLDGNTATTLGGALYVTGSGSTLVSEKAVMTSNSASKGGAVAAANSAVVELMDTSLQANTATNGAAIAINSTANLTMTESALALNVASSTAGGILAEGAAILTVSDSNIEGNTATTRGGAMVLANTGVTQIMRNYFGGNTAADAGAIDITAGTKAINNNTFYDNSASSATAGAIRVQGGTANLDYLTLVANSAVTNGGALLNSGGTINLSKSLIAGNTATSGGNVYGAIVDGDYNLVGFNDAGGMAGGAALSGTNSKVPTAAEAAALTDLVESAPGNTGGDGYYSDVKTVPLAGGGLARDAIAELDCGYDYDTRGELRPDKKSGLCDIGAYEFTILSCTEDAQRRYDQGELFVKYCDPALENFEFGVGSIGQYFIWMLVALGLYRYQRKQQFS